MIVIDCLNCFVYNLVPHAVASLLTPSNINVRLLIEASLTPSNTTADNVRLLIEAQVGEGLDFPS